MRKLLLLLSVTAALMLHANAQSDSTLYKKGKFGFSTKIPPVHYAGRSWYFDLNVQPEIFIAKQLSLAVDFNMTFNNSDYKDIFVNPSLKYYILNKRFTPVVSAGIKYGYFSLGNLWSYPGEYIGDYSDTYLHSNFKVGLSLMNKKGNFFVESGIETFMVKGNLSHNLFPYFRMGFYLNRKK